jgi:hypothetical protein
VGREPPLAQHCGVVTHNRVLVMAGPTRDGDSDSLDDDTVAARWAELTASLGDLEVPGEVADGDRGTRVDAPGTDAPGTDVPGAVTPGAVTPGATSPAVAGPPAAPPGPRDYVPDEEDDEGYEPPEPESLTHADPALTLGWVAALGSVLVGFVLFVVWRPVPTGVLAVLGLTLLAGVALLLWRMPDGHDDDRSDGAVV